MSAWFAGAETAFLAFNRTLLPLWIRQNRKGAGRVKFLVESPERFLVTSLTGNNIANVAYSSLAALWMTAKGVPEPVTLIAAPLLVLIFGETLPKTIAYHSATAVIRPTAIALAVCRILLWPIVRPVEAAQYLMRRRFLSSGRSSEIALSRSDIRIILDQVGRNIAGLSKVQPMLKRLINLGEKFVGDIMTPRTQVTALQADRPVREALDLVLSSGFSRFPCYNKSPDDIVGVVTARALLNNPVTLREVIMPLPMVPEGLSIAKLPQWFRKNSCQFAGVIDEYGGFAGVVSLEDLAEALVGPIQDEYDAASQRVVRLTDDAWLADGSVRLGEFAHLTGIEFPAAHARSIGGVVVELIGRLPRIGDEVVADDIKLRVIRADDRRVKLVRITRIKGERRGG